MPLPGEARYQCSLPLAAHEEKNIRSCPDGSRQTAPLRFHPCLPTPSRRRCLPATHSLPLRHHLVNCRERSVPEGESVRSECSHWVCRFASRSSAHEPRSPRLGRRRQRRQVLYGWLWIPVFISLLHALCPRVSPSRRLIRVLLAPTQPGGRRGRASGSTPTATACFRERGRAGESFGADQTGRVAARCRRLQRQT